jgi:hypothetical protein
MACACVFSEFGKGFRSGMNVSIVARAAEIFDLATEEAAAAEAEAEAAPAGAAGIVEVIYDQESVARRGGSGETRREWWDKSD